MQYGQQEMPSPSDRGLADGARMRFPAERVLVGVCGSTAALTMPSALGWMRLYVGIKHIRVVMTASAARLVSPTAVSAVTGTPTVVGWDDDPSLVLPHTDLASWAEVILVMPATANALGQVANGLAPTLLTSCILAAECPVVFAPAMNATMWNKPSTQRSVAQLKGDGHTVVAPAEGYALGPGSWGIGAMADVSSVIMAASTALSDRRQH